MFYVFQLLCVRERNFLNFFKAFSEICSFVVPVTVHIFLNSVDSCQDCSFIPSEDVVLFVTVQLNHESKLFVLFKKKSIIRDFNFLKTILFCCNHF
jgi:hypothetical protein